MQQAKDVAESVAIGHPDKVCDQISDAILDACLREDPYTRAAIEVVGGHGQLWVVGELTTRASVDIPAIAREVYHACGYEEAIEVTSTVVAQSPEIARGVDDDGAGDQGIMVGYACNETPECLPRAVTLARTLTQAMGARDGKAQVTMKDGVVHDVVTSVCDPGGFAGRAFQRAVEESLAPHLSSGSTVAEVWRANPNGPWQVGGFAADAGVTGRKLAVDGYGPQVPLGGGCFSGKDATKVDRSGAYMARRIAVDYLREREAAEVYVYLAYAIGVAEPCLATVVVDGVPEPVRGYDLRPRAIIEQLDLRTPRFWQTAARGHFGAGHPWDR